MTVKSLFDTVYGFWRLRIASLLLLVFLLAAGIFYLCRPEMYEAVSAPAYDNSIPENIAGEIVDGVRLRQSIKNPRRAVAGIAVKFGTYVRTNHGKIRFYLKDDTTGEFLYDTLLDMGAIADNQYHRISFHRPIKTVRGHEIAFYLEGTPECRSGNSVTCWTKRSDMPGYEKNDTAEGRTILYETVLLKKTKSSSYLFLLFVFGFAAAILLFFPIAPRELAKKLWSFGKERIFALVLLAVAVVFVATYRFSSPKPLTLRSAFLGGEKFDMFPRPILADTVIRQPVPLHEPVTQILVRFGTYGRKNHGIIRFYVKDDTADRILYSTTLKMAELADNQYKCIRFPTPISVPAGHDASFYLKGTPECTPTNCVACWKHSLYGKTDTVSFKYTVLRKSFPFGLFAVLLMGIFILALLKDSLLLNLVCHPEKVFLLVGAASALALTFCSLPFAIVDAPAQLMRLYQVGEGKLLYRPKRFSISPREAEWSNKLSIRDVLMIEQIKVAPSARGVVLDRLPFDCGPVNQRHNIMGYSPFAYLHSALVGQFARKTGMSLYNGLMLISIVSIFVYLFWMYTALRCLPYFKWPMLLVALMPTAFWYGISLSADSFVMVSAFLFFSWCMKLRESDHAYTSGELAILAILAVLLSQCKFIYFPILTTLFLLPVGNFKSRRHFWCFTVAVIVASVFLGGLWNKVASDQAALLNLDGRSTQEKMLFIIVHPWQFAVDLWHVIAATWLPTLKSAVQQLSFVAAPGHPDFWIVYFLVFFSYFFIVREKSLILPWRVLFAVVFLGSIGMIYAAIFCVNMLHIIQGRYLIPLFPLLFLVFGKNKFGLPEKYLPYYKGFLVIFLIAAHILAADALYQAYWI